MSSCIGDGYPPTEKDITVREVSNRMDNLARVIGDLNIKVDKLTKILEKLNLDKEKC